MLTLVGNWLFSEGSGTVAADSTSNHDDGTLVNAPTWISGPTGHGNALMFNGVDQSVDLGNPAVLNVSGQITISAWVYNTTTTMATDGVRYIVSHGSSDAYVFLRTWGGSYEVGSWTGSNDNSVFAPIDQLDLNNWVLLTGVYDGSKWILYKNGVNVGSTTVSTGAVSVDGDWMIGDSTPYSGVFSGGIDDVGIYNTALTSTQVAALFPSLGTPSVTLTKNSNTQVTVSWPRLGGAVTAFNVYRSTTMGFEAGPPLNATPITNPSSGTVKFIDTSVDLSVPGAAYFYKVVSLDGNILGKISTEKSLTTSLGSTEGGSFVKLAHNEPIQEFVLLTDGTVLGQLPGSSGNQWMKLTPDSAGNYQNGTWTSVASMSTIRDYMATSVLRNGNVFVAGGEYGPTGAWDPTAGNSAEVYDPIANTWTLAPTQGSGFFDSESKLLPNGDVLTGAVSPSPGGTAEIYHVDTNTWSTTKPYAYGYQSPDELTWLTLPDGSILMPDYDNTSQRYIPSQNKWVADADMPAPLNYAGEMGPGFMLPNGKAVFFGGSGNTLIYTPSGTSAPGSWVLGAKIPYGLACSDVPGAIMRDGKIILSIGAPASAGVPNGFRFVAYDYTTDSFQDVGTGPSGTVPPEIMLCLPNGSILMSDLGTVYQFTPSAGLADPSWASAITRLTANTDGSWTIAGTQLNGMSSGASMGDDFQMATNYPIVELTDGGGHVYFARTTNWSSTAVQTGSTPVTAQFTLPAGLPAGSYSLVTIANGIPSPAVTFTNSPLLITGSTPSAGATVTSTPTSYVVTFNTAIDPASLQASDLTVNGLPATGVSLSGNGLTATFTFSSNPVTAPGTQTIALAAGAVSELGNSVIQTPAFSANFTLSATAPKVNSSSPAAGGTFTLPAPFTYDLNFNTAIDPTSLSTGVLSLSGIPGALVTNAVMLSGNTAARFTIGGITTEGTLTISLTGGSLKSSAGLGVPTFSGTYNVDISTLALTLTPQAPLGSLVSTAAYSGVIGTTGDVDTLTIAAGLNQTISVVVTSTDGTLQPSVTLYSPSNVNLGSSTAIGFGQSVLLQTISTGAGGSGTYKVNVSGVNSSHGSYKVSILLDSTVEAEGILSGNSNNISPQDINGSSIPLGTGSGAKRLAVTGKADGPTADYYSFTATAGEVDSIVLTGVSSGNVILDLLNSGGTVLASAIGGYTNLSKIISRYAISTTGTYQLRVLGDSGTTYSLVVTQNGAFDSEPNNSFTSPQNIDNIPGVLAFVSPTDDDWFSLSVTSSHEMLSLSTFTPPGGSTVQPTLDLYSPDGSLLTSGSLLPDGHNQSLQFDAIPTGIYRVHVQPGGGTQGEYYLKTSLTPAAWIQSVTVDNGTPQRSMIRSLTVTFGGAIATAPSGAFTLTRGSDSLSIPVTASSVTSLPDGTSQVTLSFSGAALENGSLPNGWYALLIDGSQVLDSLGQKLDAAGSGMPGSAGIATTFFRLSGDANGDGVINAADMTVIASNWLTPGPSGDVNGDGIVNAADMTIVASNWLATIPAAPPVNAPAAQPSLAALPAPGASIFGTGSATADESVSASSSVALGVTAAIAINPFGTSHSIDPTTYIGPIRPSSLTKSLAVLDSVYSAADDLLDQAAVLELPSEIGISSAASKSKLLFA